MSNDLIGKIFSDLYIKAEKKSYISGNDTVSVRAADAFSNAYETYENEGKKAGERFDICNAFMEALGDDLTVGEHEILEIFKEADLNHDGSVSETEYAKYLELSGNGQDPASKDVDVEKEMEATATPTISNDKLAENAQGFVQNTTGINLKDINNSNISDHKAVAKTKTGEMNGIMRAGMNGNVAGTEYSHEFALRAANAISGNAPDKTLTYTDSDGSERILNANIKEMRAACGENQYSPDSELKVGYIVGFGQNKNGDIAQNINHFGVVVGEDDDFYYVEEARSITNNGGLAVVAYAKNPKEGDKQILGFIPVTGSASDDNTVSETEAANADQTEETETRQASATIKPVEPGKEEAKSGLELDNVEFSEDFQNRLFDNLDGFFESPNEVLSDFSNLLNNDKATTSTADLIEYINDAIKSGNYELKANKETDKKDEAKPKTVEDAVYYALDVEYSDELEGALSDKLGDDAAAVLSEVNYDLNGNSKTTVGKLIGYIAENSDMSADEAKAKVYSVLDIPFEEAKKEEEAKAIREAAAEKLHQEAVNKAREQADQAEARAKAEAEKADKELTNAVAAREKTIAEAVAKAKAEAEEFNRKTGETREIIAGFDNEQYTEVFDGLSKEDKEKVFEEFDYIDKVLEENPEIGEYASEKYFHGGDGSSNFKENFMKNIEHYKDNIDRAKSDINNWIETIKERSGEVKEQAKAAAEKTDKELTNAVAAREKAISEQ